MAKGERLEGIDEDPLDSASTDYKMNYSSIPGFVQREVSKSSGKEILSVQPKPEAKKYVDKLLAKARGYKHAPVKEEA